MKLTNAANMRTQAIALCCLLSSIALADNFDDRIQTAESVESDEKYNWYHKEMYSEIGKHLANTMRGCFEEIEEPQTDTFFLVASVSDAGEAKRIEVRPSTNISRCFAEGLAKAEFPDPPEFPGDDGFPIVIEMKIE